MKKFPGLLFAVAFIISLCSRIKAVQQTIQNKNISIIQEALWIKEPKMEASVYKKVKINCNEFNCKSQYGRCVSEDICECNPGYVHAAYFLSKKHICRYKQFPWIICILLELILPGLGMLYFSNKSYGLAKLFLMPVVYYNWKDSKSALSTILYSILGYSLIILHVKDLMLLISNQIPDLNGVMPY